MDTQGIEVLHRCYGKAAVIGIADALELNLLPALQTLLNKNLWSESEGRLCQFDEFLLIGADTRTQTTQSVSRTDHDGEADLMSSLQRIFHRLYSVAHGHLQIHLCQLLHKEVAVFCVHDGFDAGTKYLDTIFFQSTVQIELCTTVQGCLTTEGKQNTVWTLFLDDLCYEMGIDRLEINLVCNTFTGLDGCDVGVDEYTLDAFLAKGFQGL